MLTLGLKPNICRFTLATRFATYRSRKALTVELGYSMSQVGYITAFQPLYTYPSSDILPCLIVSLGSVSLGLPKLTYCMSSGKSISFFTVDSKSLTLQSTYSLTSPGSRLVLFRSIAEYCLHSSAKQLAVS